MPDGPLLLDAVLRRGWRAYAGARRRLSHASNPRSQRRLARARSVTLTDWNRSTSERHERYRADHPPATGTVGIVCVSRRPGNLAAVIENVERQRGTAPEFVLVPNGPDWDRDATDRALQGVDRAVVVWGHEAATLGGGLNGGIAEIETRFVAKFDDDDHYGPNYLTDALRAHRFAGAGVVGKHSYYADIDGVDGRWLRFGGNDFRYSSTLAGGTLVIDRDRTGELRFDDVSLGEDRAFIHGCHRRGISTYSADRFSFVQHRGADNTWQPGADEFLVGSRQIDAAASEHEVDR